MKRFYEDGLRFTCRQCSHCCKDEPGYVFLSEQEMTSIAGHLSISEDEFIQEYCKTVNMGTFSMISIRERKNNDCIFLSEAGCTIYPVRPVQCRSYPFWASLVDSEEDWEREAGECPGMNEGELHSREEIEGWLQKRRENQPKMFYN